MRAHVTMALILAGCGGHGLDSTDYGAMETGTTSACQALTEGTWTGSGSCFGMAMSATLTLGSDGCSFTFSDWSMAMSVPDGGTVDGTDVTLSGTDWDDCTGTTDGSSITGTCGNGCSFDLTAG